MIGFPGKTRSATPYGKNLLLSRLQLICRPVFDHLET